MDVDGTNTELSTGDTVVNTIIIESGFTSDLSSNTLEVSLPMQIPKCFGVLVEHFSMVDDGTPLSPNPNGTLLILRSPELCSSAVQHPFYMAQTTNTRLISPDIYNNTLGWTVAGRKNSTTDLYPLGLPQNHRVIYMSGEQSIQRFRLNIDNINMTLNPHTSQYTLQLVLKIYSRA
jgi:hypothetical protein